MKTFLFIFFTICLISIRCTVEEDQDATRKELVEIIKRVDPENKGVFSKTQYRDFMKYMVFGLNLESLDKLAANKLQYHERVLIERVIDDFLRDEGKDQWTLEDILKDLEEFKLTSYLQNVFKDRVHETLIDEDDYIIENQKRKADFDL